MATFNVHLSGGPCNGENKTITQAEWDTGATTCKGGAYYWNGVTPPKGQRYVFTYRPGAPPPGSGTGPYAPRATKGWDDLRNQVNRGLPSALAKIGAYNRATSRSLSRRGKV